MNLPPKLKLNDEVIIIAPARKVELESLIMAENLLLKWGLKPLRSKNILAKTGIFAGDKEKSIRFAMGYKPSNCKGYMVF